MAKFVMTFIAGSLGLLFAGCERSMIYYPSSAPEAQLEAAAQAEGMAPWRNAQGERIGWVAKANASTGDTALLLFHGNAGHAAHRSHYAHGFRSAPESSDWDIYLFEYPGYGSRQGEPSEKAIKTAARSALERLLEQSYERLFLAGESLGSGVASYLAGAYPERVDGLFLVTPFTSLQAVAKRHYPDFLVSMLTSERYDNLEALEGYESPLAVMLAERDEVVPADLGRALYERYRGTKELWIQENRGHNTLSFDRSEPWWSEVAGFLSEARPDPG